MEKAYMVRKLAPGGVSYRIPGKLVARKWVGKDARLRVPYEELEECIYDPSINSLFTKGYLFIESKEARVALGLEESEALVLDEEGVAKVLFEDDLDTFKEKIDRMAEQTQELLVQVAIANLDKHAGYEKYDIIRKKYKVDIEAIHRRAREDAEQGG